MLHLLATLSLPPPSQMDLRLPPPAPPCRCSHCIWGVLGLPSPLVNLAGSQLCLLLLFVDLDARVLAHIGLPRCHAGKAVFFYKMDQSASYWPSNNCSCSKSEGSPPAFYQHVVKQLRGLPSAGILCLREKPYNHFDPVFALQNGDCGGRLGGYSAVTTQTNQCLPSDMGSSLPSLLRSTEADL